VQEFLLLDELILPTVAGREVQPHL
jgi:hypothetical protein